MHRLQVLHHTRRSALAAGVVLILSSCTSPSTTAPTPAPAVAVVTPVPPTSVPAPATEPKPTTVLMATPPPATAATVVVPTAVATIVTQATTAGSQPVVRSIGELPPAAGALPAVESDNPVQDPGFLTPIETQFELSEPVASPDALRALVDGVQRLSGVAAVKSDGIHVLVQYDTARIQLPQLRQRLSELGHAPAPGTEVSPPGDAAD
jgi:hypothetical protein